jgi:hypothetical protein
MKRYDLTTHDSRKSFYGKCHVIQFEDGTERLYSYETAIIDSLPSGELVRIWDGWSATTGRHIMEFCGLNKAAYDKLRRFGQ